MTTRNFAGGGGRKHVLAIFALIFVFSFAPVQARAADGFFESLWCDITGFFGIACEIGTEPIQVVETKVSTTIPPSPQEMAIYTASTTPEGRVVYTTVVEEHNTYITNPTTIIRQGGGGSSGSSEGVSLELFHKQVDRIYDSMGNAADGLRDDIAEAFTTALLTVSGNASIGGDLNVVGTLTAGSLAVSSVSSGGAVEAPYFTATSTTQASTFPYASTTAISSAYASSTNGFFGSLSVGNLTGFLKATAGAISTATIDLVNDVGSSILAVANGGTGWANLQANTLLLGNGTGRVATTTAGTNGQVLALVGGVPTWTATTTLANISGTLAVAGGGTGATTFTDNRLLTGNGASALVDEANLTFDGTLLTITGNASTTNLTTTGNLYLASGSDYVIRKNGANFDFGAPASTGAFRFRSGLSGAVWVQIDNTTGNVGLGSTTPSAKLSVKGAGSSSGVNFQTTNSSDSPLFSILDSGNVGIGNASPSVALNIGVSSSGTLVDGAGSTFTPQVINARTSGVVGISVGVVDGTNNRRAGLFVDQTNGIWGLSNNYSSGNIPFVIRSASNERLRIDTSGNVGIGTTSPSAKLAITQSAQTAAGGFWLAASDNTDYRSMFMDTSGILSFNGGDTAGALNTATLNAAGAWTNASDRNYKENIEDIPYGLDTLNQMQPRYYEMKGTHLPQVGFIAQELKELVPEVVDGKEGSMGISYGNLVAVVVKAIQELSDKVSGFADSFTTAVLNATTGNFTKVNSETVDTKTLCLDGVCITKSQLQDILDEAGENSAPVLPPVVDEPENAPPDEVSEPDTELPVETPSEEPTPEPEPEPTPEPTPETP